MTTTEGGLTISANLTYPHPSTKPRGNKAVSLVAFCVIRIEDGRGFNIAINSVRLMWNEAVGRYFLSMPGEPKLDRCPRCGRQNASHASYCNWCGCALNPAETKGWFSDVVSASLPGTRKPLLNAVLAEHERQQSRR